MRLSFSQILIGGLVVWAAATFVCTNGGRRERKRSNEQLDKALKGTYPASDPTATQDFAIPANRL